jgi:hypothetical protein
MMPEKSLKHRLVELQVNAEFIAAEHADVLRPQQIERLYAMRALLTELDEENVRLRQTIQDAIDNGCECIPLDYFHSRS